MAHRARLTRERIGNFKTYTSLGPTISAGMLINRGKMHEILVD
jgi:hypothetical protein